MQRNEKIQLLQDLQNGARSAGDINKAAYGFYYQPEGPAGLVFDMERKGEGMTAQQLEQYQQRHPAQQNITVVIRRRNDEP